MAKKRLNTAVLRRLAEDLLWTLEEVGGVPASGREDLATSLVRQWVTYDGQACLFLGGQAVSFTLGRTPLGKPRVALEPGLPGWMSQLTRDWKIAADDLPGVLDQLNRGQSAEVTNAEGVALRLWVNPKERSRGVEPLVKRDGRGRATPDYRKIAVNELEQQFGDGLDPEELDALARSVARQWQEHGGHASLFLDGGRQLVLTLAEEPGGGCVVSTGRKVTGIEEMLASLGLPPEAVPEAVTRINLGQEFEFRDRDGVPAVLWHDPRARRVFVRPLAPDSGPGGDGPRSIFCPRCGAVLSPGQNGGRQPCPLCGHASS